MFKKNWKQPTLFFALSILIMAYMVFETISAGGNIEGWAYRVKNLFLPVVVFMVACDLFLKWFIQSLRTIWIVELVLLLAIVYYWIVS